MKNRPLGSLRGDLDIIADRITKATQDAQIVVWVSDLAEVHAAREASAGANISPVSIVGTYTMGMSARDIVDDLLEVRRERLSSGVLD
jgi:hypothetical protein